MSEGTIRAPGQARPGQDEIPRPRRIREQGLEVQLEVELEVEVELEWKLEFELEFEVGVGV